MTGDPVVPLGRTPPPEPPPRPSRPFGLHAFATTLLAISMTSLIVASISYVTVTWSGTPRRFVIGIILFSGLLVLASLSASILTAARHTYASGSRLRDRDGDS